MSKQYFKYGKKEMDYLKQTDVELGKLIDAYGKIERPVFSDLFTGLVHTIIAQLISTKAADSIFVKLETLCGKISVDAILAFTIDDIKEVGLTRRKAETIYELSKLQKEGQLNLEDLRQLSDKEVIACLCKVKGIGDWTVQIFLIHALNRVNIISYKDLAIRKGLCRLYGLDTLSKEDFNEYEKRFAPYNTIASFYLWKLAHDDVMEVEHG